MVSNTRLVGQSPPDIADAPALRSARDANHDAGSSPDDRQCLALSERDRIWIEQNQAFFDYWNDYVDKHGIPLAEFRNF